MGLPTILLRPTTTQRLPRISMPDRSSIWMTPAGVQLTSAVSSPMADLPTLTGWNPSTSLAGSIARRIRDSSRPRGSGS